MGGQTILLHAVFLTNHYMTKQYIMYKSKAACQTVITIALVARPNRAERKYVLSKIYTTIGYVYVLHIMGTCLPFLNFSNFLVN